MLNKKSFQINCKSRNRNIFDRSIKSLTKRLLLTIILFHLIIAFYWRSSDVSFASDKILSQLEKYREILDKMDRSYRYELNTADNDFTASKSKESIYELDHALDNIEVYDDPNKPLNHSE